MAKHDNGRCQLVDGFAVVVQMVMACTVILVLLYKRQKEYPRRPLSIWVLDVSKQCMGAGITHLINLSISSTTRHGMDPCVRYSLHIVADSTVGVALTWCWHSLFWWVLCQGGFQPMESGSYGPPPFRSMAKVWGQQTLVFVLAMSLTKLCIYVFLSHATWLIALGTWALSWSQYHRHWRVVLVMFGLPLVMNALQFWVTDTLFSKRRQEMRGGKEARMTARHRQELSNDCVHDERYPLWGYH